MGYNHAPRVHVALGPRCLGLATLYRHLYTCSWTDAIEALSTKLHNKVTNDTLSQGMRGTQSYRCIEFQWKNKH